MPPQPRVLQRLGPAAHANVLPTALHARSQGAVIGQGSVAESWLAVTQGACTNGQTCAVTFCKNNRLFDGEARCCKTVDNHTTVMRARVGPTMRAAERARHPNREGRSMPCSYAHTFASEARTWAFAVLHLVSQHFRSIILRLLWACSNFMIGSLHAQCSHVFTRKENGPEEDGRTRCSGLGQRAAPQVLFCKYCEGTGSATLATMKRWNQYRGELHAPPHIPRRPTSWERLVYGVPIEQSNRLGCQRPGGGHVMMMGSRRPPARCRQSIGLLCPRRAA
jgi:hypothetical protein